MAVNFHEEHDYVYCNQCGGAAVANKTPRHGADANGFDSQCLECHTEFIFHPTAAAQPVA